jgi:hypothetical protein
MDCFMATYLIGSMRNFLIGRLCADWGGCCAMLEFNPVTFKYICWIALNRAFNTFVYKTD